MKLRIVSLRMRVMSPSEIAAIFFRVVVPAPTKIAMSLRVLAGRSIQLQQAVFQYARRNIGVSAVVFQKAPKLDPIQKLYLEKLREYASKSKASGGSMVDVDPKTQKSMQDEILRLEKLFGGGDMTKFPEFQFKEIDFDAAAK
ncbi:ATP synthase-coupling factor 6, mitochondrial-like isoform X1 [Ptychodera flava]|uniref:ATP synthase-coupling factor 6, mitochondrial-like isoform X1 n=2 Tax=Ptychodera flava TaxID=63121 RepID=UPI00396A3C8E